MSDLPILYRVAEGGPFDLQVDNGFMIENITDDLVNAKILSPDTRLQAIADARKALVLEDVEWDTWYDNAEAFNELFRQLDALIGGYEIVDDDIEPGPGLAEALTQADEIDALTEKVEE